MIHITDQRSLSRPNAILCSVAFLLLLCCAGNVSVGQDESLEDALRKFAPAANQETQAGGFPEDIWQAIEQGHLGAVEEYLDRVEKPASQHPVHGRTPLSWAAATGNTDALVLLLDHDADPNARNRDGSTPLHDAALMGEAAAANLLLEHDANPKLTNRRGETPLDTARLSWSRGRQLGLAIDREKLARGRADVIDRLGGRERRALAWAAIAAGTLGLGLLLGMVALFQLASCAVLTWSLYQVPADHRHVRYWQIWILSVPCVALVGNFFVLPRLTVSYSAAFGDRFPHRAAHSRQLGFWFSVFVLGSCLPPLTVPCGIASVTLFLLYVTSLSQMRTLATGVTLPGSNRAGNPHPDRPAALSRSTVPARSTVPDGTPLKRRYDLDALRGAAMLLGIGLHSAMPFGVGTWPIQDPQQHDGFRWFFCAVHGFRMQLFFLLSGFFTCMLWQRRGLRTMLWQRFTRVAIPLVVGTLVIVPVMNIASVAAVIGTTALSLRMEAEQEVSSTPADAASEAAATRYHVPGLIDFDGLISTYGLVGFVLFYVPVFQHLWFLWFLCWLVAMFAAFAAAAEKWDWKAPPGCLINGPRRYLWIIPVTLLFQSMMVLRLPWFGPDTSTGILPAPHVLGYFGVFFAFGALYFASDDQRGQMGRWWWLHLAVGWLVVLPVGMTQPDLPALIGLLLQVLYTWSISFGMLGLFRKCFRQNNPAVRYLSDASYWLYLTHIPLVVLCQWWVYTWNIPALIKFLTVAGVPTVVLLVVYHLMVRHTWIGTALNGPRTRPAQLPIYVHKQG